MSPHVLDRDRHVQRVAGGQLGSCLVSLTPGL
jgi:hypothetical protein